LSLKDDLISQLTQRKDNSPVEEDDHFSHAGSEIKRKNEKYYSPEKAENLYWTWF
jgi:hypothetical protein